MIQGDSGDNIPTCVKCKNGKMNPEGRGIGKDGAVTVYKLYKEIHPATIQVDSDEFIDNLSDVIIYYKKIKDSTAKMKIMEQLKFNRMMMVLNPDYMPKITYENMKKHYNDVENMNIGYEVEDLESKLEEDDFFKEPEPELPEQFMVEDDGEEFDPDSFWDL